MIPFFERYFVKPGIVETSSSQIMHTAFEIWQVSDGEDFFMPTQEDVQQQLEYARRPELAPNMQTSNTKIKES